MKRKNKAKTMSGAQKELRCLLTSTGNALRLFSARAAVEWADGANRFTAGGVGGLEGSLR